MSDKKWVQKAFGAHPGALHIELGVPQGKTIPPRLLKRAENSRNPTMRKQANLAETAKRFDHRGGNR